MASVTNKLLLLIVIYGISCAAEASPVQALCRGNLETPDRKILHAGVSYWLWYNVTDSKATVRLAGREFTASADTGSTWNGVWLQHFKDGPYLSYLPSDGGTIKAELESGVWFSGNCLPERA